MSDRPTPNDSPDWLNAYEELANDQLEDGSSCEQVHPVVAQWFTKLMAGDPPESRDSVVQAVSCLATEVMMSSPDNLMESLLQNATEDEVAIWVEQILLIGRAFEISLHNGDLDDL